MEATCKNCMHKMSYNQLKKLAPQLVIENKIKRGQYVCPFNNYTLIKDMENKCKQHVFEVNK